MRIGIVGGTGPAGSALGARLASVGYRVVIGSRSAERAQETVRQVLDQWAALDLPLEGGSNSDAADGELVIMATPWDSASNTAVELRDRLRGKVVVSMANALVRIGNDFQPLVSPRGSIASQLQAVLPDSWVVAAFQHVPAKELGHLEDAVETDVLVCSDHAAGSAAVIELICKIPGCRALDAGLLSNAMAVEALTATLLNLNIRYRTRVAPKFTGVRD